jgi:hypothetical protein
MVLWNAGSGTLVVICRAFHAALVYWRATHLSSRKQEMPTAIVYNRF